MKETFIYVEGTYVCRVNSHLYWTFTCGRCSCVEGHSHVGYSHVEGHSHVEGSHGERVCSHV